VLSDEINRKVTTVICFGAAKDKIYNSLKNAVKCRIEKVDRLKDAIDLAFNIATEGTVLFLQHVPVLMSLTTLKKGEGF